MHGNGRNSWCDCTKTVNHSDSDFLGFVCADVQIKPRDSINLQACHCAEGCMFLFSVKDMHACDSAVAIVKAVRQVDEGASVFVSLERRGVEITPECAGATELSDAIADAGFTPELLPSGRAPPRPSRTRKIPFDGPDHDFSVGPSPQRTDPNPDSKAHKCSQELELPMIAFRPDQKPMLIFHVADMVNRRTAGLVQRAVLALDRHATVRTDFMEQRLDVEPSTSDAADLIAALKQNGFAATIMTSTADSAFAWVDSRHPELDDTRSVATQFAGLLPAEALGPLAR